MFEQTGEERYVKEAEKAVYSMFPQAVKMDCGIGWKLETGENPISGMAHGNAGILMPVLALWELTKKQEYEILAEKIREYEESLYREEREMCIRDRYLGTEEEHVLLPKKQVPKGAELGDPVEVFLYKDSRDRLIATTNEPVSYTHLDVYKRQA